MKAKSNDINITRGDSEGILVKFNNYELQEDDVIEMTVRKNVHSMKVLHKIADHMEDGTALITIQPEDTEDLDFGEYVYDIQMTFSNGSVKTLVKPAKFFVGGEVTYD